MNKYSSKSTNRTNNIIYAIITLLIVATFIVFLLFKNKDADYSFDQASIYDWSEGWFVSEGAYTQSDVNLPVTLDANSGETILIKKSLPDKIKKYNCLMYYSKHQDIIINVGGILRTSYNDSESRIFGRTSPSAIVLVPLYSTDEGKDVTILMSSNSRFAGEIGSIYLGNEKSIILMLVKRNIVWAALCVVSALLSLACLLFFFMYRNTVEDAKAFIYLFIFGIVSSTWTVAILKIRQMIIGDIHYLDNLGYLCFMISPVFVAAFSNKISRRKNYLPSVISYSVILLNFIVQSVLQINGIADFYSMCFVTELVFIIYVVSEIVLSIVLDRKESTEHSLYLHVALLGLLAGLVGHALGANINTSFNFRSVYSIGILIYLVFNVIFIFINIGKEQRRKKDAENANIAKSQFLATMSHEIRTPINAVLGMNEMILRESNEPAIREYAGSIADAGRSLLSLVNDILDFSKIESGKMDILDVEYQMKSLLRDLILMIKGRIARNNLELILKIDENIPSVYFGDEVRIKQVLTNMLTNAAKYTPSGSITLTVENRGIEDDEIELLFSVKDTGIGIKEEDIEKLMTSSFIRVDQIRNRNIEGTGLGITITRLLLNLMGSKLELRSEYGKGSEFYFVLKQKIVDSKPMGSVMNKTERTTKKNSCSFKAKDAKILTVDDTKTNLLVIKGLLKPYECKVDTCESGEKCIELCKENIYDVILMDHMMPGMDGIETLKELRKGNGIIPSTTKVIALTANAVSGAADMYKENGFDAYITKPIDTLELDECLKNNIQDTLKMPI